MAAEFEPKFYFHSDAVEDEVLRVVDFEGYEEISRPFRFEINLISEDPELDLKAIANDPAWLGMERDGTLHKIHGMLAQFEQREWGPTYHSYRAVLVPRLWLLSLRQQNQVFAKDPGALTGWSSGLKIDEILGQVLKEAGFASDDFEIKLQEEHAYREYVVQHQESDLAFISRLMEHEGIFYFFEHDDDKDKLIIADKNERFEPIAGEPQLSYRPPTGMVTVDQETVHNLLCKQVRVPKEVMLKDYNWRTPSLDLTVTATVDDQGQGLICEYGDHYKDKKSDGATLARFRAEEIACGQTVYLGESNGIAFRAGWLYELADHFRPDFDQEYLITSVRHRGSQSSAGASAAQGRERTPAYRNEFTSIVSDVPYRPARITPRPRILGTINGKVDAAPGQEFAEMDDYGRYRVALALDQGVSIDKLPGGSRSRWVRMAQPHSGRDTGMHFPLRPGTEVLLTHIGGDPDRPVIASTVPNTETRAPVENENHMKNVMRTGGSNWLEMDDAPGQEGFLMTNKKMGAIRVMRARPRGSET